MRNVIRNLRIFTCCCAGHFDDAFRFTSDFPGVEGTHPYSDLNGRHDDDSLLTL